MADLTGDALARYAQAIVRTCLAVGPDDVLAIHGEPDHRPLVTALGDAAYAAGARLVDAVYVDMRLKRSRIAHARDGEGLAEQPGWHDRRMHELLARDAALVTINGESEPALLAGLEPRLAARETTSRLPGRRRYLRAVAAGTARFCVVAWPLPGWAGPAYPELDPAAATARVAEDLLSFCRLGPDDGPTAWAAHLETLAARAAALDALELRSLELRAPGTELTIGLPPDHAWVSAAHEDRHGRRLCANFPTEEVFTSPRAPAVEGTFRCSRSLALDGRQITGIAGELRGGRLVRVEADDAGDRDYLAEHLAQDDGAGRLGELALVDRSSRIGQSGRSYGLTLLDENAAAHIAFGSGFAEARRPVAGARRSAINQSRTHVDVMIGTDDMGVTGRDARGRRVDVIRDGAFVL